MSLGEQVRISHSSIEKEILNNRAVKNAERFLSPWRINGSPAIYDSFARNSYESSFYLFGDHPIRDFFEARSKRGLNSTVLDLAGGNGTAVRDLSVRGFVQSGLTISLGDMRNESQKQFDAERSIGLIEGDLLTRKAWRDIDDWLKKTEHSGFSAILCRPVGGMPHYLHENIFHILLQRTWMRLDNNDGMLLTSLPLMESYTNYSRSLRSTKGIRSQLRDGPTAMLLIKTPQAPEKLP